MKLLELYSDYLAILGEIEAAQGELCESDESRLESIGKEIAKSADKADWVFRKLDSESDFYDAEIKRLQGFKKTIDNANERLREFVKTQMVALDIKRIEGDFVALSLSRTKPKVVVDNESILPAGYFEEIVLKRLSKTKLSEDLALGPVDGAHLEQGYSLRVTRSKK
jgi:hypothetical protein